MLSAEVSRSFGVAGALVRTAFLYWCVLSLTFVLLRLAPGDPATFLLPSNASAADAVRLRAALGLGKPVAAQYAQWSGRMLHGDLGTSFSEGRPVVAVLDFTLTIISVVLAASPAYWLSLGAIALFTYVASLLSFPLWARLPAVGMTTPGADLHGLSHLVDLLRHSILPVTLLAAIGAAGIARYVRTSALEVLDTDWVRTARAKGVPERAVLGRHLIANMRAPLVTLFALMLPGIVAGSVFVETIFGWPGVGRLMVRSITTRDYPVVMGCTAAYALLVIVANLVAELLLPWADPRLRG
jgi:peptide/nickel transport system permease protein